MVRGGCWGAAPRGSVTIRAMRSESESKYESSTSVLDGYRQAYSSLSWADRWSRRFGFGDYVFARVRNGRTGAPVLIVD